MTCRSVVNPVVKFTPLEDDLLNTIVRHISKCSTNRMAGSERPVVLIYAIVFVPFQVK